MSQSTPVFGNLLPRGKLMPSWLLVLSVLLVVSLPVSTHARVAIQPDGSCENTCGTVCTTPCRTACPHLCPSINLHPPHVCAAMCGLACDAKCTRECPEVCPFATAVSTEDLKLSRDDYWRAVTKAIHTLDDTNSTLPEGVSRPAVTKQIVAFVTHELGSDTDPAAVSSILASGVKGQHFYVTDTGIYTYQSPVLRPLIQQAITRLRNQAFPDKIASSLPSMFPANPWAKDSHRVGVSLNFGLKPEQMWWFKKDSGVITLKKQVVKKDVGPGLKEMITKAIQSLGVEATHLSIQDDLPRLYPESPRARDSDKISGALRLGIDEKWWYHSKVHDGVYVLVPDAAPAKESNGDKQPSNDNEGSGSSSSAGSGSSSSDSGESSSSSSGSASSSSEASSSSASSSSGSGSDKKEKLDWPMMIRNCIRELGKQASIDKLDACIGKTYPVPESYTAEFREALRAGLEAAQWFKLPNGVYVLKLPKPKCKKKSDRARLQKKSEQKTKEVLGEQKEATQDAKMARVEDDRARALQAELNMLLKGVKEAEQCRREAEKRKDDESKRLQDLKALEKKKRRASSAAALSAQRTQEQIDKLRQALMEDRSHAYKDHAITDRAKANLASSNAKSAASELDTIKGAVSDLEERLRRAREDAKKKKAVHKKTLVDLNDADNQHDEYRARRRQYKNKWHRLRIKSNRHNSNRHRWARLLKDAHQSYDKYNHALRDARAELYETQLRWDKNGQSQRLQLRAGDTQYLFAKQYRTSAKVAERAFTKAKRRMNKYRTKYKDRHFQALSVFEQARRSNDWLNELKGKLALEVGEQEKAFRKKVTSFKAWQKQLHKSIFDRKMADLAMKLWEKFRTVMGFQQTMTQYAFIHALTAKKLMLAKGLSNSGLMVVFVVTQIIAIALRIAANIAQAVAMAVPPPAQPAAQATARAMDIAATKVEQEARRLMKEALVELKGQMGSMIQMIIQKLLSVIAMLAVQFANDKFAQFNIKRKSFMSQADLAADVATQQKIRAGLSNQKFLEQARLAAESLKEFIAEKQRHKLLIGKANVLKKMSLKYFRKYYAEKRNLQRAREARDVAERHEEGSMDKMREEHDIAHEFRWEAYREQKKYKRLMRLIRKLESKEGKYTDLVHERRFKFDEEEAARKANLNAAKTAKKMELDADHEVSHWAKEITRRLKHQLEAAKKEDKAVAYVVYLESLLGKKQADLTKAQAEYDDLSAEASQTGGESKRETAAAHDAKNSLVDEKKRLAELEAQKSREERERETSMQLADKARLDQDNPRMGIDRAEDDIKKCVDDEQSKKDAAAAKEKELAAIKDRADDKKTDAKDLDRVIAKQDAEIEAEDEAIADCEDDEADQA